MVTFVFAVEILRGVLGCVKETDKAAVTKPVLSLTLILYVPAAKPLKVNGLGLVPVVNVAPSSFEN